MRNLPQTLKAKSLAKLLSPIFQKSEKTIIRDISRNPKFLPPFEIIGGKKIWCTENVLEWLPSSLRAFACRSLAEDFKEHKQVYYPPPILSTADMLLAGTPTTKIVLTPRGKS